MTASPTVASLRVRVSAYLDLLGPGRRSRWALLVFLAVLVGLLEALGAFLVFFLLGVITNSTASMNLPLMGTLNGATSMADRRAMLLWVAAVIAGFFILRGLIYLIQVYVQQRVVQNAGARLSSRLVQAYLRMPYGEHLQRNSSELVRNAYVSVQEIVGGVFVPLVVIWSEALLVLGIMVVLIWTSPTGTMAAAVTVLLLGFVLLKVFNPKLVALGVEMQQDWKGTLQALQQSLGGIRDIKLLGREPFFEAEFMHRRFKLARTLYIRGLLMEVPRVVIETGLIIFIAIFVAMVVWLGDEGRALPTLGLFAYAGIRLLPSVNKIVTNLNSLQLGSAPVADVRADLEIGEDLRAEAHFARAAERVFNRSICLDSVNFRHAGAKRDALIDVNLEITKGERLGMVGPTGGGKSTLLDVILGLVQPSTGTVRVDGVDLQKCLGDWQALVGMVSQSVFLIDDSIRRNIALGVPEHEVDEERLLESIEVAQLSEFLASLPDGLDSQVGERGVRISGGESQRIAVARALYRRPEVIVFDEGTSALDRDTERRLLRAIDDVVGTGTLISVAHRISSVRELDRILVISDGRIVAEGSFEELAKGSSVFRELAR